jgi:large subunit ribosomal protein L6
MSRIGKMPVPVPKDVTVHVGNGVVQVKGKRGELLVRLLPGISAKVENDTVHLEREDETKQVRSFHGLNRALLANAVTGVSTGWKKELEIIGIGYRVEKQDKTVVFNLGYSHSISFPEPEGISIDVQPKANRITVEGIDRQRVGQVAAEIRALRPPEPYKGKGIRYVGEHVRRKAGKQGAKA